MKEPLCKDSQKVQLKLMLPPLPGITTQNYASTPTQLPTRYLVQTSMRSAIAEIYLQVV